VSEELPGYLAYLLRMWRVEENGRAGWRASLERPSNGKRFVFASLEAAFDFLRQRAGEKPEGPPEPPDEEGR
jgi:hypothetical protein